DPRRGPRRRRARDPHTPPARTRRTRPRSRRSASRSPHSRRCRRSYDHPYRRERALDRLERRTLRLVLLDEEPLDSGLDGRGQDPLVVDHALADGSELAAFAAGEVLHVDEGAPAGGASEEGTRISASVPGPAEVELEEDVIPSQQLVQEAAPAVERSDLAIVVVEAELHT